MSDYHEGQTLFQGDLANTWDVLCLSIPAQVWRKLIPHNQSFRGTVVPLLAVSQVLETPEQLAFLMGPLAARRWCHSEPKSRRAWWRCGQDT